MAEENNIGASRLLGTNGLQQAVDSLTQQVTKMSGDIGRLTSSIESIAGRTSGGSSGGRWNSGSNSSRYGPNGGNATFSGVGSSQSRMGRGGMGNGGGGSFGNLAGGSRLSAGIGTAMAVGGALVNYANKNMSTNMMMDYVNTQAMANGGWGSGGQGAARTMVNNNLFQNRYGALSASDAAQAAVIAQQIYGNAQFNGQMSSTFTQGLGNIYGAAYANPTLGVAAAAQAQAQISTPRAMMMGRAYGLNIGPNTSLGGVAQQIMSRTFGNAKVSQFNFSQSMRPGQPMSVNLQYLGQQLGLSQTSQQEIQGLMQGQVNAAAHGMSATQYYKLLNQASAGNNNAAMQLSRATGLNTSMFEKQRNLTDTRLTRQSDILNSLAPAFDKATDAVNQFSKALTAVLKDTGLDQLIGTSAGFSAPFSNAAGGFMNTLGMGGGLWAASKLFRGGGGFAGGMASKMGARFAGRSAAQAAAADEGMMTATADSAGVFSVTSGAVGAETVAGGAAAGGLAIGGGVAAGVGAVGGAALLGYHNATVKKPGSWQSSVGDFLSAQPFNPFGAAYLQGGMLHRGIDWLKGTNEESFWSLLNPWGHEKQKKTKPMIKRLTAMPGYVLGTGTGMNGGGSSGVSGGSANNGASNMGANAAEVINFAKKELGVPYGWGQEKPGVAFDCSGLLQWAFGQAGVSIPRIAADQQRTGTSIPTNNTQPGDLLFVGNPAHHVVMNAGGGQIIEAPHTGAKVRLRSLNPSEFDSATRIVNSVGNVTGSQSPTSVTLNQTAGNSGGDIGGYSAVSELANVMAALGGTLGGGPINNGLGNVGNGTASTTTSGSNGSAGNGNGKNDTSSLQAYAKSLLGQYGWSGEWDSFNKIVMSESGWDVHATNPSSGAYGIPQSLPGNKMASAGSDWRTNGDTQLRWMMSYIKDRYGDPNKAWSFHQRNNSYAVGAWDIDRDQIAKIHQGEMIVPAQQAETIRQALVNNTFNPGLQNAAGMKSMGGGANINVFVNMPDSYSGTVQELKYAGNVIAKAIAENDRVKNLQIGQ